MSWRENIKNRIIQMRNNNFRIINKFPTSDDFNKNSYMKNWVTALFVDISGYTNICETKSVKFVAVMIRTFHEGILLIMKKYGLKHIQIQGDGIFGVLSTTKVNDINSKKIFDCAMEINGYLKYFWKLADYKISIAMKEELMILVGRDEETQIVFAGGAVNEAKKLMESTEKKNVILLNNIFVDNNKEILWNRIDNYSYIHKTSNISYSTYYFGGWEYYEK